MTNEEAIALLEALEASEDIKNPLGLLERLKTANDEAKTSREALEAANEKIAGLESFKTGSKNTAIVRELKAAGVKNPDKIVRLMKTEDIDFSEEGALTGFDEQFEGVKTDWPELFDKKRNAPNVDQFQREEPTENMSATQQQLAALRAHAGQ